MPNLCYGPLTNGVDGDKLDEANREQNEHKSKKHPQDVLRRYVSHQDKTQRTPGCRERERGRERRREGRELWIVDGGGGVVLVLYLRLLFE